MKYDAPTVKSCSRTLPVISSVPRMARHADSDDSTARDVGDTTMEPTHATGSAAVVVVGGERVVVVVVTHVHSHGDMGLPETSVLSVSTKQTSKTRNTISIKM